MSRHAEPRDLDWPLLGASFALALIGVLFIDSAKHSAEGVSTEAAKQAFFLLASIGLVAGLLWMDYRTLADRATWIYAACVGLLVALIPFGHEVGGERSRLVVPGLPFTVQPSEFMKVGAVLMLAGLAARREPGRVRFVDVVVHGLVILLPVGLILMEPDEGTALTFLPLLAVVIFVSGLRYRWIAAAALVGTLMIPLAWPLLKPHQQARFRAVPQPELYRDTVGYQMVQARIAVGSGGFTGRGFGKGPQNRLGFLPERHTDFIFAIVAEEWGFLGAVVVLGLYLFVLKRIADAAVLAKDRLGAFICLGALSFISAHLVVNVGMVLGLLPTIGITLPLLSYGGSSLLATFCLIGLAAGVRMRRFTR